MTNHLGARAKGGGEMLQKVEFLSGRVPSLKCGSMDQENARFESLLKCFVMP